MPVTRPPTNLVNGSLTTSLQFGVEPPRPLCQWHPMARRNARSGGIFLTIGVLGGFAWGMAAGNPMKGILIGTALGALAALLLWLLDRRG